jgi:hypothetical protein
MVGLAKACYFSSPELGSDFADRRQIERALGLSGSGISSEREVTLEGRRCESLRIP